MSDRRMLHRKISVSEQVSELSERAMLIFTWMIPHTDDIGIVPANPKTLKALVCPVLDISLQEFKDVIKEILNQQLVKPINYQGKEYYIFQSFYDHQQLRKDIKPVTYLSVDLPEAISERWKRLLEIRNALVTDSGRGENGSGTGSKRKSTESVTDLESEENGSDKPAIVKGMEDKGSEDNKSEANVSELKERESERKPTPEEPAIIPAPSAPESTFKSGLVSSCCQAEIEIVSDTLVYCRKCSKQCSAVDQKTIQELSKGTAKAIDCLAEIGITTDDQSVLISRKLLNTYFILFRSVYDGEGTDPSRRNIVIEGEHKKLVTEYEAGGLSELTAEERIKAFLERYNKNVMKDQRVAISI